MWSETENYKRQRYFGANNSIMARWDAISCASMSDVEKKNNMLFRKEEFYALIVVFILFGVPIIGLVSILFPG